MLTPKVSILVPNYNHARFLEERLASIFYQTYDDYEVILLDDCSSDESLRILEKYEKIPSVKGIFKNKVNSGSPFMQWQKGVELASGEYVWIAESDDVASRIFLDRMVAFLDGNPEVVLAYCRSIEIDENSEMIGVYKYSVDAARWDSDFIVDGQKEFAEYLMYNNTIPNASGVLTRKYLWKDVTFPDRNIKAVGDWFIWSQMTLMGKIGYISESMNYFRFSENSTRFDHSFQAKGKSVIENLYVIKFFLHENMVNEKQFKELVNYQLELWDYAWIYCENGSLINYFDIVKELPGKIVFNFIYLIFKLLKNRLRIRTRLKSIVEQNAVKSN
jgi:glycosyltransferase involved in cell wall biosynthesis